MKKRNPPWLKGLLHRIFTSPKENLTFLAELVKNQDIVRMPVLKPTFIVNDPAAIQHILLTNNENYTKVGTSYTRLENLVGKGLLTTSGKDWEERRARYQPKFHGKNLREYVGTIQACTELTIKQWQTKIGKSINVTDEMLCLVMNITTQTFLGLDVSARSLELVRKVHLLNEYSVRRISLSKWLPTLQNLRYQINKKVFDQYLLESLKGAKASSVEPLLGDILIRDEEGHFTYSDEYILGEAKNFFVAGHETTGNAISWTFYSMLKNTYIMLQVLTEIEEVIGDKIPDFDSIEKLPYLEMVVQEALRLYPPIWLFTRKAIEDDYLLGYKISANSIVLMIPYLIHRHPTYWNQPDIFYPERFLPDVNKKRPKSAYIPFGMGPRVCIGRQFAMMNMKIIIVMLLQKFKFHLPQKNYEVKPLPLITLKPDKGIWLRIENP